MKDKIQGTFQEDVSRLPGIYPRLVSGYTVYIYFTEKINAKCVKNISLYQTFGLTKAILPT